jgi:hypothetical protein
MSTSSHFQVSIMQKEPNQFRTGKPTISIYDLRVWGEINYLDSATDYRESLTPPGTQPSAPVGLEFLDDQIKFSWAMIAKFVSITATACAILLILTSNS